MSCQWATPTVCTKLYVVVQLTVNSWLCKEGIESSSGAAIDLVQATETESLVANDEVTEYLCTSTSPPMDPTFTAAVSFIEMYRASSTNTTSKKLRHCSAKPSRIRPTMKFTEYVCTRTSPKIPKQSTGCWNVNRRRPEEANATAPRSHDRLGEFLWT